MPGKSQRKSGPIMREVFEADIAPVEAKKINAVQPTSGA
jgi:hypothetical protein